MRKIIPLFILALAGCTTREVSYQGVSYKHNSFLSNQNVGKVGVTVSSNGVASVVVENYSNDQVSALREAKEILVEANKLKSP